MSTGWPLTRVVAVINRNVTDIYILPSFRYDLRKHAHAALRDKSFIGSFLSLSQ